MPLGLSHEGCPSWCYDDETCPSRYDDDDDDDGREGRVPMFDRMKKKISGMEQDLFINITRCHRICPILTRTPGFATH